MAFNSSVIQDGTDGNPAPSYKLTWRDTQGGQVPCFIARNFGIAQAAIAKLNSDFKVNDIGGTSRVGFGIFRDVNGSGIAVAVNQSGFGSWNLSIGLAAVWGVYGSMNVTVPIAALTPNVWGYNIAITALKNNDGTVSVTAEVFHGTSVSMGSCTATLETATGDYCGAYGVGPQLGSSSIAWIDNFHVQGSGSLGNVITDIATNYVYTFVNDLGEQSAPALPSITISRPDGVSVTVTTPTEEPTGVDADYGIVSKRIYRAATGSTGTAYRFVAEIPLDQADYVDTLTDTQLGEVLPSDIWELPPIDLEGILALPNGVMVGFRENQLCFSAQNQPHAWPVSYRLNTDTKIVGIGNIDTTVIIGTESFVYVASGSDPSAYSMAKFEVPHAASSKRSFAYITGLGVVFAGPDGLMVCAGFGQLRNLTETVFTRRQWQALNPPSIFSVSHNDIYFMFWQSASSKGCYAVDLRANGFGVVEMAFHASAAYVDPVEDKLYLVLDADDEPDNLLLPIPPSTPPYIDARTIFEFEGDTQNLLTYSWLSKLYLCTYPSFYAIARLRAKSYDNTVVRFKGNGEVLDEIVVEGDVVFTLTTPDEAYDTFEMEVVGTDAVRILAAADDVTELP